MMSEKRKALLAYKEKILKELKYYDSRIEEISTSKSNLIEESDSSDSEPEFLLNLDFGPSVQQLKKQQSFYQTCLDATVELTGLQIQESTINVLVVHHVIKSAPPVCEKGVWREVTAGCKIDLVKFNISFYVHVPDRQFGSRLYRDVQVTMLRAAHANELETSILAAVSTPSDAIEVVKSYALADRSRRSTLSSLADKYADFLHMEPMPEGGYLLKCADLLEVTWVLVNKWSPIASFHHLLKFNLEYMDESYIKIITQAHRQLSNPCIETDERTFLLSKIISTCLEAQGPTQELYESMSSDPETAQSLRQRRTTLEHESEQSDYNRKKDREVMAPPKSLPKKAKPKGKENVAENRKAKKLSDDDVQTGAVNNDELTSSKKSIVRNELKSKSKNIANDKSKKDNCENGSDKMNPINKEVTLDSTDKVACSKNATTAKSNEKKTTKKNTDVDKVKKSTNDLKLDSEISADKKVATKKSNNVNDDNAKNYCKVKKNNATSKKDVNKAEDIDSAKTNIASEKGSKEQSNEVAPNNKKIIKNATTKKGADAAIPNKSIKNKNELNNKTKRVVSNDNNREKVKNKTTNALPENPKTTDEHRQVGNNDKLKTSSKMNVATNKDVKNKAANDKAKSIASNNKEIKKVHQEKQDVNPKSKQDIRVPTKPVKEKVIYNEQNNQNKDKERKESTVNKVVERCKLTTNLKRKSNLADIIDKDDDTNVAIPKKPKFTKSEALQNAINNQVDKEDDRNSVVTKNKKTSKPETLQNKINKKNDKDSNINDAIIKKPKLSNPLSSHNQVNNKINEVKELNKENKLSKPPGKFVKKIDQTPIISVGSMKTWKTGNIGRVFNSGNISKLSSEKASKIPQKKMSATLKKNPLHMSVRTSPRKLSSKFKSPNRLVNRYSLAQKTTSIPRLMKRPSPKT